MRLLLTNDDGIDAPGLRALVERLASEHEVYVVAPDRERSAASHSLTLERPLRIDRIEEDRYRVDGTPTDCVHLAVTRLTGGRLPDLVLSGYNRGLNVGDDVTYSGTVAGALEGTLLHVEGAPVQLDCAVLWAISGDTGGWEGERVAFADPLFCDAPLGDYTVQPASPCLPGQGPVGCELIGRFDLGCDSPVATESVGWGQIKLLFR